MLRKGIYILMLFVVCAQMLGFSVQPAFAETLQGVEIDVKAEVYKVIDGDTFDGFPIGRVRLADINAPELDQPGGIEAKNALTGLILDKRVYLDVDNLYVMDRYNRLVCVVYVRHNETHLLNVNKWLLDNGHAIVSDYPNEFSPAEWSLYVYYPRKIPALPLPEKPPSPEPGYEWVVTDEAFLYMVHEGINYSAGLVFGLYLPQTVELNKNYTIYVYAARVFESNLITFPPTIPIYGKLCIGIGIEYPMFKYYLHVGLGSDCEWDRSVWHILLPIPPLYNLTLSTAYPNITYAGILDVPLNRWDGPYKAQFNLMGGYTQVRRVAVKFAGVAYNLSIFSNSKISNLKFIQKAKMISFNVSGAKGTGGFCNITIPKVLLAGPWKILVDGEPVSFIKAENETHSSLYFAYTHSVKSIQIIGTYVIPEYSPTAITLALVSILTAALAIVKMRILRRLK